MNVLRFGNEESGIPVQGNGSDRSGFGMQERNLSHSKTQIPA